MHIKRLGLLALLPTLLVGGSIFAGSPILTFSGECKLLPNGSAEPISVRTFSIPFLQTSACHGSQAMPFVVPGAGDAKYRTIYAFAGRNKTGPGSGFPQDSISLYVHWEDRLYHVPTNPFHVYTASQALQDPNPGSTITFNHPLKDFFSRDNYEIKASDYTLLCVGSVDQGQGEKGNASLKTKPAFGQTIEASCHTLDGKYTVSILNEKTPRRTATINDSAGSAILAYDNIFIHALEGGEHFFSDDESGTGGGSFQLSHNSLMARRKAGDWLTYPTCGVGIACDF